MGDHRASIKIEMEFHGKVSKTDMYINYCPMDDSGVDSRIIDFFEQAYREGMVRYHDAMYEADRERREWAEREADLKKLAELKEKYEK